MSTADADTDASATADTIPRGHPQYEDLDVGGISARLQETSLCTIITAPAPEAIAAAGILVATADENDIPFHLKFPATYADAERVVNQVDDGMAVLVGYDAGPIQFPGPNTDESRAVTVTGLPTPEAAAAYTVATTLGSPPSSVTVGGLVGTVLSPSTNGVQFTNPGDGVLAALGEVSADAGVEAVDGLALPTNNFLKDILASTWTHTPYSGQPGEVAQLVQQYDLQQVTGVPAVSDVKSEFVSTLHHMDGVRDDVQSTLTQLFSPHTMPLVDQYETTEGLADVFRVYAYREPVDAALTVAGLGGAGYDSMLEVWREIGKASQRAVHSHRGQEGAEGYVLIDLREADDEACPPVVARLLQTCCYTEPVGVVTADAVLVGNCDELSLSDVDIAGSGVWDGSLLRFVPEGVEMEACCRELLETGAG